MIDLSDHTADCQDPFIGRIGYNDTFFGIESVDDLSAADIQAHMTIVADEVAGESLLQAADRCACASL